MAIRITRIPTVKLEKFADQHNLTITIRQRPSKLISSPSQKFYATIDTVEIVQGYILRSTFGNGATPQAAIRKLAKELSEQVLRMSFDDNRITAPKLV